MGGGEQHAAAAPKRLFDVLGALAANPAFQVVAAEGREAGEGDHDAGDGAKNAIDNPAALVRAGLRQRER